LRLGLSLHHMRKIPHLGPALQSLHSLIQVCSGLPCQRFPRSSRLSHSRFQLCSPLCIGLYYSG